MQTKQVQLQAKFLLGMLVVFTLIYAFYGLGGLLRFSFLEPELMIESHFTGGNTNDAMRWMHFFTWLPANVTGIYACFAAIYVSYLAHIGGFFTLRFAGGLGNVGYAILLTGIGDIAATALVPHILSSLNPAGQLPIRYHFSPEELGLALCGIGFAALGKLMSEATRLSDENREFV